MENKKNNKIIMKELKKEGRSGYGLSLSDMERQLSLSRGQIRIGVAFLLGAKKIEEQIYGRSKVYYEAKK